MSELTEAIEALDNIIKKARVHFYKPIQIAEILHRDRTIKDIDLSDLETYRIESKKWRDVVTLDLLSAICNSSSKYQDDLFNENAVPPIAIESLAKKNRKQNGIVEAYIYDRLIQKYSQLIRALDYCRQSTKEMFSLEEFIGLFWKEAGLRRSIDKVYEIIVYSLFSTIVEELEVEVEVSLNPEKKDVLKEFETFAEKLLCINSNQTSFKSSASINRAGVANAADRGLDMWANFGPAIQVKHLSLSEKLAGKIVSTVTSDRIVIVCKDSEESLITSLLNQLGWKSRIQSIVVESELLEWYEKALRGIFSNIIGDKLLKSMKEEIILEFPIAEGKVFQKFYSSRGYDKLSNSFWKKS